LYYDRAIFLKKRESGSTSSLGEPRYNHLLISISKTIINKSID
jgi:hypothetical protein